LVNDLDTYDEVKCSPKMFYSGDIDDFWGNQTDGLKIELWKNRRRRMYILESSGKGKSTWQIRVG
jgi:hypothetical protein